MLLAGMLTEKAGRNLVVVFSPCRRSIAFGRSGHIMVIFRLVVIRTGTGAFLGNEDGFDVVEVFRMSPSRHIITSHVVEKRGAGIYSDV